MGKLKNMALSENTKVVLTLTNTALILIAIIGFIWGIASFTKDIEKSIEFNAISIEDNSCEIEENGISIIHNEKDIDNVQIDMAKIFVELANVTERQVRMLDILEKR